MAATRNGLEPSTRNRGRKGLSKVNNKEIIASSSSSSVDSNIILTENDIPGASLNGRNPSSLKNEELKFWLRCRGDSLKGLKTKACFVKRWAYATIYTHGFGRTFTLIIFVFIIGSKNISLLVEIRWWSIRIKIRFIRKERPGFQICRPNTPLNSSPKVSKRWFLRAEMNQHIESSGKKVGNADNHSIPTNLRKAKTFLRDEYLKDIEANSVKLEKWVIVTMSLH